MRFWFILLSGVILSGCQNSPPPSITLTSSVHSIQAESASRVWPVVSPLPVPDSLRPCCAFGYNLKVNFLGIPVPFYRLPNVVAAEHLGVHSYNDSAFGTLARVFGLSRENNGVIYTRRGGFIDVAHVRDTADMTFYLFSHIWPRLGLASEIRLDDELGERWIKLFAFTAPTDPVQRYTLSAYLAARIAFQLAAWHEIAQWYGYRSLPGFSEMISAFSPEDLYSNLLGGKLAIDVLFSGYAHSVADYNLAMQALIPDALQQLEAVSTAQTRVHFDQVEGTWWDSQRRVPEKFLLLRRDYQLEDYRRPARVPGEKATALTLQLPAEVEGFVLSALGELQIWPGKAMKSLPRPLTYYTYRDFPALAAKAKAEDDKHLLRQGK